VPSTLTMSPSRRSGALIGSRATRRKPMLSAQNGIRTEKRARGPAVHLNVYSTGGSASDHAYSPRCRWPGLRTDSASRGSIGLFAYYRGNPGPHRQPSPRNIRSREHQGPGTEIRRGLQDFSEISFPPSIPRKRYCNTLQPRDSLRHPTKLTSRKQLSL
jgi:hypothetical protein